MSNDPASGDQPGWQGQQPYPGYGQQRGDQPAYGGSAYPPPTQQGYGQSAPPWSQPAGQPGGPPGGQPAGGYPGGTPGGYPAGLGSAAPGTQQPAGFFGALFDFGFNHFATPVVIKVLYLLGLVAIAIGYVVLVFGAFASSGVGYGLLVLVLGAVGALFYVIFFRVLLEFYYAIVRMAEDIRVLRDRR